MENDAPIRNAAAPEVAKDAWIKSQTLLSAADSGEASVGSDDDQPIIKNEMNDTGRRRIETCCTLNLATWKISRVNQIAVIIDSNNVTNGGCPLLTQRITPKIVNVIKARRKSHLAVLNEDDFLNISDISTRKKVAA